MQRQDSYAWARLKWRLGRRPPTALTQPPVRPIGVKLELTYACNLRCGFCYTDSPRRTLQRSVDLPDEDWRRVAREALDLGVLEAVVTGGEPLLRKDLTLELVKTLASGGVGVTLNTNGWFVDEAVAGRLRGLPNVTVYLSIDGARPGLHDGARGVPGSWRRAVEGVDRLLDAGVDVCVIHVVTPDNVSALPEFLEQMWLLGVPVIRVTPVVETGAAARGGAWRVSRRALRRAVAEFEARRGTSMGIVIRPGNAQSLALQGRQAPGSFLVRPNGDVRTDSLRPFKFGNAARDGVAACWEAIRTGWRDERIERWAGSLRGPRDLAHSELVSYLDDEVPLADAPSGGGLHNGRDARVPEPSPPESLDPDRDLALAREKVRALALARRYSLAPQRRGGGPGRWFIRRAADGRYLRLNESGVTAMDTLDGGTPADTAALLDSSYRIGAQRAENDAIASVRELTRLGLIIPAGAGGEGFGVGPGSADLPDLDPVGRAS